MNGRSVLIVDDQRNMRATLSLMLRNADYVTGEASTVTEARTRMESDPFGLVLSDLRLGSDHDGMDVLRSVKEVSPLTEVIMMTAYGSVENAVEAMRAGAYDYIQKPFAESELLVKIEKALEKRQMATEMSVIADEFRHRYSFEHLIGRSAVIREVLARIVRIAPTDATVLITGESGTGKELVARAIHVNSLRAQRPFLSINCAAMSETLLESELFGHVRGAFTGAVMSRRGLFEEADGGTFFFDEIAETPPSFQAKLLRAIQEREIRRVGDNQPIRVDVRVIAATNQDLKPAISEKRFRQDLYYRLNVVRFNLPPLRERMEDIPLLVDFFLKKYSKKMRKEARLGAGVLERLMTFPYAGNVRELENLIEQGVALSVDGEVQMEDVLSADMMDWPMTPTPLHTGGLLQNAVDRAEREAIQAVLEQAQGSKERAAEMLGLSVTTLWRKMKRLHLVWPA